MATHKPKRWVFSLNTFSVFLFLFSFFVFQAGEAKLTSICYKPFIPLKKKTSSSEHAPYKVSTLIHSKKRGGGGSFSAQQDK